MQKSALQLVLKYKEEIMGLATLWVMLYHSDVQTGIGVINGIKQTGYGGVDIFIFVSGMGIYYSLKKNDLKKYALNRMWRIYPTYIPLVIVYMLVFGPETLQINHILGNLTGLGFAFSLDNQPYWYVSLIIILYILAPYLYAFITSESKRPVLRCILLLAGTGVVSLVWLNRYEMLAAARLPIFVLGMIATYYLDRGECPKVKNGYLLVASVIMLAVGSIIIYITHKDFPNMLWDKGLHWYPFLLFAPAASVLLAYVLGRIASCKGFAFLRLPGKCLTLIGRASWEIYLVHVPVFLWFVYSGVKLSNIKWLLLFIPCIAAGILWHWLVDKLVKKLCGHCR